MENEAQKMISSTTADQKEVSGGDDVAMNQEGAKMEEDHQIGTGNDLALSDSSTTDQKGLKKDDASMNEGGTGSDSSTADRKEVSGGDDDVVMNLGSGKMEEDQQKESGDDDVALSDSSSTDQKDDSTMNEGGTGSESSVNDDACRSRVELSDSSRLLMASPIKRKFEWIPAETETTSGKLYTNLNHREDVVDAVYQLSEAYDHRRLVRMVSATGSVSKIHFSDDLDVYEISQIASLSLQDFRPCRNNSACSVSWTHDEGKTYKVTGVNFLVAYVPIEITAELEEEKSAGESSAVAAAAQDGNSDSGKAIEELEAFATNLPAADGNINPTSTTGAATDQDKKSPSEEDI